MPVKHPFYIRLAAILLSVLLILFFLHEGRTIIIPLFFSVLIAFSPSPWSGCSSVELDQVLEDQAAPALVMRLYQQPAF